MNGPRAHRTATLLLSLLGATAVAGCQFVAGPGGLGLGPSDGGSSSNNGNNSGNNSGGTTKGSGRWVLGYYVGYQADAYPPERVDFANLSHIAMGRLKTNADGTLRTDFDIDATRGPQVAKDLSARAKAADTRTLLMLGGVGEGAAIRAAAGSANRAKYVQNLLKTMDELGYDGLDLDWEDDIDWTLFKALASELRAARPSILLTAPTFPINANIGGVEPQLVQLAAHLDQVNLMSYHPATAYAGAGWQSWHNSPLAGMKATTPVSIEDSLQRHVAAGIPKAKLGMGVAFYAICYTGGVTGPSQSTGSASIEGGDNDYPLSELFAPGGLATTQPRQWDPQARASYITLSSAERHGCRYVSFEDRESLLDKGRFTKDNGYGGIIVWTLAQGYVAGRPEAERNLLFQALGDGFLR